MPLIILGGGLLVMQVAAMITGVPLFHEFRERVRRTVDRNLPVTPLATRARQSLDQKLEAAQLRLGAPVFVRIFKREAELEIWMADGEQYRKLHTYPICRFSGFLGPKLAEGDRQSPEGFYSVTRNQLNPGSRHYRAFNIGFPNEFDRAHGRTGSALMVHGGCTSVGCYAMTDLGVGQIYRVVEMAQRGGQRRVPVHIFPFRMTVENMSSASVGKWNPFWQNIKTGYDMFERTLVPPQVRACGKRYEFGKGQAGCKLIAGWS